MYFFISRRNTIAYIVIILSITITNYTIFNGIFAENVHANTDTMNPLSYAILPLLPSSLAVGMCCIREKRSK